jgi:serine/threonine protein kinase
MLADFIEQCLNWYPQKRPSAEQMLGHKWLAHENSGSGSTA